MLLVVTASLVAAPGVADATEPVVKGEPRIMREPGQAVDVIDAFDDGDPLDVTVGLAFELDIEGETLARERGADGAVPVADLTGLVSRLRPSVTVGVYRDLALSVELPLVLSRTRAFRPTNAATSGSLSAGGETLATLPFDAPERSGLERLTIGAAAGILNQTRDRRFPTWVVGLEARIDVSTPKHACNPSPPEGEVACADPADLNRNGKRDAGEAPLESDIDPGIGRGTLELAWRTAISRRIRYFEPYGILEGSFEVPIAKGPLPDALGATQTASLPVKGAVSAGVYFVPWENRERFSRISVDARVHGGLSTRGLDYSPMFDAIGSSDAPSLRASKAAPDGPFHDSGVTVVDAFGTLGASGAFSWRASELIAIGVGGGVEHAFSHRITGADACAGADACDPTDPIHREILDAPGSRFVVEDAYRVQISAQGSIAF